MLLIFRKRAARVITGSNYEVGSSELFRVLKRDKIKEILDKRKVIMIYKELSDLVLTYVSQFFTFCNNSTYELRSNESKLYLRKSETNFLKRSFLYRGAVAYNNLNNELSENFTQIPMKQVKKTS